MAKQHHSEIVANFSYAKGGIAKPEPASSGWKRPLMYLWERFQVWRSPQNSRRVEDM
jgi:hypothetical protein